MFTRTYMVGECLASWKTIENHGSNLCNPPLFYHLEMSVGSKKSSKLNPGNQCWPWLDWQHVPKPINTFWDMRPTSTHYCENKRTPNPDASKCTGIIYVILCNYAIWGHKRRDALVWEGILMTQSITSVHSIAFKPLVEEWWNQNSIGDPESGECKIYQDI